MSARAPLGDALALSAVVTEVDWEQLGFVVGDQLSDSQALFLVGLAAALPAKEPDSLKQFEYIALQVNDADRQGVYRTLLELADRINPDRKDA